MINQRIQEIISTINSQYEEENPLWFYSYGRDHWQNLQDLEDDSDKPFEERKKYLMLLWKDREKIKNKHGATVGLTFIGQMLLVVRSRITDSDYEYKYEHHIKNLEDQSDMLENYFGNCDDMIVKAWKEIEVENLYDTNLDGLKINFTIEYEG